MVNSIDDVLNFLILSDKREYKCYDLLIYLLNNNNMFFNVIKLGINTGNIMSINNELFDKLCNLNVRWPLSMDEVLRLGGNIGGCTTMSYELSFLFSSPIKCAGILPILKGTKNSINGEHTWIEDNDGIIYDTSLMMEIKKVFACNIGYQENIREKYNSLNFYLTRREYALDKRLSLSRKLIK